MPDAFDRLSPALRYQIVNALGWAGLRPVQELTTHAILDGKNAVVLAPTAGGKTEAAFFPLLSRIDQEGLPPLSVIYLTPIKALLNNQEARLSRLAELIGRRVTKWHGDVRPAARRKFLADPTDILLTTPESIESMLVSTKVDPAQVFRNLRAVVIDEIHAFAGDDRGAHLSALLERLTRLSHSDVQRIGLSATVGNPETILDWMNGSSKRPKVIVDPPKAPREPVLTLDYVGSIENAATLIEKLHPGKKRLVFADSRRKVEAIGQHLLGRGVRAFVIHSSLSVTERTLAERAFEEGKDCVIVATSALELGLDVGDLDHVLQIDAPRTVASFLQRMGRTGRRPDTTPNCTFLATDDEGLMDAACILHLHARGFVEPVRPPRRASHVLAQQLLAMVLERNDVAKSTWFSRLEGAMAFADLSSRDRTALLHHMLEEGLLAEDSGLLMMGKEGERRFGRIHFRELMAIFSSPRVLNIYLGQEEIGSLDETYLRATNQGEGKSSFILAGRAWQIESIDWSRGRVYVQPTNEAQVAKWSGSPGFRSFEFTRASYEIQTSHELQKSYSRRAKERLALLRQQTLPPLHQLSTEKDRILWHTHAGGAANLFLSHALAQKLGGTPSPTDAAVRLLSVPATPLATVHATIQSLLPLALALNTAAQSATQSSPQTPAQGEAQYPAESGTHSPIPNEPSLPPIFDPKDLPVISKFQRCLPPHLAAHLVTDRLLDLDGALRALHEFNEMT